MSKQIFQVAIDLGFNKYEQMGRFKEFVDKFLQPAPHLMGIPASSAKGNFPDETSDCYVLEAHPMCAYVVAQRAEDTGLVKRAHVQSWN